ncbi:MAG: hypothetical protein AAGC97_10295, partial [Planctomycetota bacterium]
MLAVGANPVVYIPGFAGSFADVLDNNLDLIAEPQLSQRLDEWSFNRGLTPDKLALEPNGQVYQNLYQTLENVGYVQDQTLFVTPWDWRVPVAPVDATADGQLQNATFAAITDATFDTGLDYLAHTLQAVAATGATEVDLITHSTGGLVARAYMQSPAYGQNGLPTIGNLVMAGVPNRGVTETWNLSLDDWAGSGGTRALTLLVNKAYQELQNGGTIFGPDPNSSADDITNPAISKEAFAQQYIGAMRDLLPEFPVIDVDKDTTLDRITSADETGTGLFNDLLLDLNAGTANSFLNAATTTTVVYSTELDTRDELVERTGPNAAVFPKNEILSFDEFVGRIPGPAEIWYQDITTPAGGDGTVPTSSSVAPFLGDPRVGTGALDLVEITAAIAGTGESVAHPDLVVNEFSQERILAAIGATATVGQIESGLKLSKFETAKRALAMGLIDFDALIDEMQMTASGIAQFVSGLGNALETWAANLNIPGGIPFVDDAITTIAGFADQTNELVSQLYDNAVVTGDQPVSAIDFVLSEDAALTVRIDDEDPVSIIVPVSNQPPGSRTLASLVADINAALTTSELAGRVIAAEGQGGDSGKVSIRIVNPIEGTSLDVSTLQLTGDRPVPSSGRLGADLNLSFTIDTRNLDEPREVEVSLTAAATTSATQPADLARLLNAAMGTDLGDGTLLSELLQATIIGDKLRFVAVDSSTQSFSVRGGEDIGLSAAQSIDVNTANTELGLGTSQSDTAELAIESFRDFIALLNEALPVDTTLGYNAVNEQLTFNLNFEKLFTESIDLNFSEAVDLGFADLNLAGGSEATFDVTAGVNLALGLDLRRVGAGSQLDPAMPLSNQFIVANEITSANTATADLDLSFEIQRESGNETVAITLTAAELANNASVSDLVADLNGELAGASAPLRFDASVNGELILISEDITIESLKINSSTDAAFGFETNQTSQFLDVRFGVEVTSTHDATETAGSLEFTIERFGSDNDETVSIDLDDVTGLSTEDIGFAIEDALDAHFSVDPKPIRATNEGNKLVLVAEDPTINRINITSGAYGFLAADQSNANDLLIELSDQTVGEVVLDGAETIGDVITRIQDSVGGASKLVVALTEDTFRLVDQTTQVDDNRLTISPGGTVNGASPAGLGLGLLGTTPLDDEDTALIDESKTFEGDHLLLGSLLDQFFIDTTNSSIYTNASIDADDIDLAASIGLLELGIGGDGANDGGTADFVIGGTLSLTDP